ncbi:MAG: cytochrome c biogenesis protein ResB [Bacteroidota bacterium]|nr:cytochrome c biogenesis protein ResB [Bacteroidota bacterium]
MQIPNFSELRGTLSLFRERPWKFKHGFIAGFLLFLSGVLLEIITGGKGLKPITMPVNIYLAVVFVFLLFYLYFSFRTHWLVKWLSGTPAALTSIIFLAMLVLLMGFIPQEQSNSPAIFRLTGLSHVKLSWPFLFIEIWVIIGLGLVILRRSIPYKRKNLGFILNHLGLWLILVAAGLGAGDISRLAINLIEDGAENNIAVSEKGEMVKLPFSLKLIDFKIDEYQPRLAFVDAKTGAYLLEKGKTFPMVQKGLKTTIWNWNITVEDYSPQVMLIDSVLQNSTLPGSCPAVKIKAVKTGTKDTISGWISSGSFNQKIVFLRLNEEYILMLTPPEVRKFSSKLLVKKDNSRGDTVMLEVNKPLKISGWKIYQAGYDQSKGKWSSLSVLEAVRDPWLPVVYLGIYLLMTGAVYMFWIGRKN